MNTNNTAGLIKGTLGCWLLGTTMCFMAATANAGVLFLQTPLDQGVGILSSIDAGSQNADNFSFGTPVKLESIGWWGSYNTDLGDGFTVRLFADNNGAPGALLNEFINPVTSKLSTAFADSGGQAVFYYETTLAAALDLQAGIDYYLSIMNDSSEWNWLEATAGDSSNWYRELDLDPWTQDTSFDFSFTLLGTHVNGVPEPSMLPLLAIGVLSWVAGSRLRRRVTG